MARTDYESLPGVLGHVERTSVCTCELTLRMHRRSSMNSVGYTTSTPGDETVHTTSNPREPVIIIPLLSVLSVVVIRRA